MASSDIKKTSNILITRSAENSAALLEKLEKAGFNCFCEALFTVQKHQTSLTNPTEFSAAIITSSNAIAALISTDLPKNLKIFCVGNFTAQKLAKAGFHNVEVAKEQNAQSLLELIKTTDYSGSILYFHGSIITLDFAKELPNVTKIAAYSTYEISNFSNKLSQFGEFDYVLVFSSNSAEIFLRNVARHNLLASFRNSHLLCLSEKIRLKANEISGQLNEKFFAKISTFEDLPILREIYDRDQ